MVFQQIKKTALRIFQLFTLWLILVHPWLNYMGIEPEQRCRSNPTSSSSSLFCPLAAENSSCNIHTEFECGNGECINYQLTCDGVAHCKDKSDEKMQYCGERLSVRSWFHFLFAGDVLSFVSIFRVENSKDILKKCASECEPTFDLD